MAISLSPSVTVKEQDLTLVTPAVSTSIGAFAGAFRWGPINEPKIVDTEKSLVEQFGAPDRTSRVDFLTAASFLTYSNNLRVVRVGGTTAKNASTGTAVLVENAADYEEKKAALYVEFVAKYAGSLGNSLRVSVADAATFADWPYASLFGSRIEQAKQGTFTQDADKVTFTAPETTSGILVGMSVTGAGIADGTKVKSVDSVTQITLTKNATAAGSNAALTFVQYTGAPSTSQTVAQRGGKNDELHAVVVDELGEWTGTAGAVLETYQGISKSADAKAVDGTSNYIETVFNRQSLYVYAGSKKLSTDFGSSASTNFADLAAAYNKALSGGVDGNDSITVGARMKAYTEYERKDSIDINLIIVSGLANDADAQQLTRHCIQIAEKRNDCIALFGPSLSAATAKGRELASVLAFHAGVNPSTYGVTSSAWKLMYDRFHDENVYVPLSGDLAGLCANTDAVADPWFSPAGQNRGFIKNSVKLSYNAGSKSEKDSLYVAGINPVVSQIGSGTYLMGDKTFVSKEVMTSRINVRRLMLYVEKRIEAMMQFVLFEQNDAFTRQRSVATVEPMLLEIQGRQGIAEFRVVCDETNNTKAIVDANRFVMDVFLRPTASINFIELRFNVVNGTFNFTQN